MKIFYWLRRKLNGLVSVFLLLNAGILHAQQHEMKELLPPHDELEPSFWQQHGWQRTLGALIGLSLVALFVIWLRRPKVIVAEPAGTVARKGLEKLRGRPEDGALVAEVSRILRRYVMAVLNLGAEELTATELGQMLQSDKRGNPELMNQVGDFLRRCDEWKFSPTRPARELNAVSRASELVEQVERATAEVAKNETPSLPPQLPASHTG